jgi:uncharacterized membrane protein YdfJ with MMPL/SSD domain
MVLVPAAMSMMGDANWWLPGWLARVMPAFAIEGAVPHGALGTGATNETDATEEVDAWVAS